MTTPVALLAALRERDIRVWAEADRLRVNAPKGALTADLAEALRSQKSALLALLQAPAEETLPTVDRDGPLWLAPGQEALWYLSQATPGQPLFNMHLAFRIRGALDVAALEGALAALVARHESLRTTFDQVDDRPVHRIQPFNGWQLSISDAPDMPAAARAAHAAATAEAAARQPLDLARGPLFVAALQRYAHDDHLLTITQHHIISDGWSHALLLRRLGEYYAALCTGDPLPQDPAGQYVDYAAWRRAWRTRPAAPLQQAYWARQLDPPPAPLALPYAATAAAGAADYRGALIDARLPADLSAAVRSHARRSGVTPYVVTLSALAALLHAYSGQTDLLIAAPVANREAPLARDLVGYVNNTVVLRLDASGATGLNTLQQRVREAVVGAFAHQELPLPELLTLPGVAAVPLTRCAFNYRTRDGQDLVLMGLAVAPVEAFTATAHVDLALTVEDNGQALRLLLGYKSACFTPEVMTALVDDYQAVLTALTTTPALPLAALPIAPRPAAPPALAAAADGAPPDNELTRRLLAIWRAVLGQPTLGPQDDFFDSGGQSLQAVRIFARIRETLGVNMPLATLFTAATVAELVPLVARHDGGETWSSLVPIQPQGSRPPFFCIHGLTGDILWFRELGQQLAPDQPLYGIQARGLDGVQAPLARVEEMADLYVQAVRRVQPAGPYLLGGASFGGTIALAVARRLQDAGEQVALLVMFDHSPYPPAAPPLVRLRQTIGNTPRALAELLRLDPQALGDRLRRKGRRLLKRGAGSGAGDLIDYAGRLPAHRQRLIEALYAAAAAYEPPAYGGPILLLRARTQPLTNPLGPELGLPQADVQIIPGSHEAIFRRPHVVQMAAVLRRAFARALDVPEP